MSEPDKDRLDRLEMKLTDLMVKVDRHEEMLQQLTARVARQDHLLSRVLNLLGLTLGELEAEECTPPKFHSLLLLMRRALN